MALGGVAGHRVLADRDVDEPHQRYLTAVRRLCDAADVLMLADEIQSGLGRIG